MPRPRSQSGVASAYGDRFIPKAPPAAAAAAVGAAALGGGEEAPRPAMPSSQNVGESESESLAYGHHSRVFDVALLRGASDGNGSYLLASAGEDEVVRVWRRRKKLTNGDGDDLDRRAKKTSTSTSTSSSSSPTPDFDQVAALRGHCEPVLRVAWGPPRSHLLASAGGDRAARIWRIEEDGAGDGGGGNEGGSVAAPSSSFASSNLRFRQAAVLPDHPEEVYACELTGDARGCVTASANRVFLWDLETGKQVNGGGGDGGCGGGGGGGGGGGDLPPPQPTTSGDGASSLSSSSPFLPPRWAAAHVFSAVLSPGGGGGGGESGLVAAACSDGCLRLWSLRQGGAKGASSSASLSLFPLSAARVHATAPAAACCWSRDGHRIAVTGSRSCGVAVVDSRTMRVCWRGSVDEGACFGAAASDASASPPSSSAMGACFFQRGGGGGGGGGVGELGGKELLAVATSEGRVALFDADSPPSASPCSSDAPSSSVALPVSYLQSRRVPPRRSMLCVAALPRGGSGGSGSVLAASGDALTDEAGGGSGSGDSRRRASKWSPVSVWEG